ncbi:MAG: asparagine synthase (glutamine-hydrolyzing) [Isosphaeraceae bacterium]|nr:asparagine synthase (glutamine-hydrolyzing) [Isosphaeraceae bacterium]
MCGIAGAFDLTGTRDFPVERLTRMTRAIVHRGPDDEHHHFEPGVALGARRLSIVDLAGGRQPIPNERGNIWVAFNGEIFEYPEIRAELLARGHTLSTRCDTEAWVHLYEDHGEGMFEHARGQFAVSLWDRDSRTLILGRDRVGICPLYYVERDGWLLWGSEVKSLIASGLYTPEPDPRGFDHLFTFFSAGMTRTFFKDVKSIAPGHFLRVREGEVSIRRYWDLDFPDAGQERRLDDPTPLIEEFEGLLEQAVERRLRGDVPVVSYISGGLDSTVVLGLTTRRRGQAVPSFSIGLDKAGPDERTQAAESAAILGSPLTMVTMNKRAIVDAVPELVEAAEGPILDTSCACLMKLARAVHDKGFKVALTGEGADEALAGYVWFKTQQIRDGLERRGMGGLMRAVRKMAIRNIGGTSRYPLEGGFPPIRTAQHDMYEMISLAKTRLYSQGMLERLGDHEPYDDLALPFDRMKKWAPLNQSLYMGYKVMLAGLLMISKGDRIAMHSSVEARYPFLDDDVIRFCSALDPSYKLRGNTEKWILRRVAARTLPKKIANRPKTMFRASRSHALLGADRPAWVDQLLSPESLAKTGWFDPAVVASERERMSGALLTPRRGAFDVGMTCVVTTQLFHHIYCGGGLCDLPTWRAPEVDAVGALSHSH